MPELPEVETIVTDLKPQLIGQSFEKITTTHTPSVIIKIDDINSLQKQIVTSVERRGKFINIFLKNKTVITLHLRMSGRIIISKKEEPQLRFERTRIDFSDLSLRFCDSRKFGKTWISKLSDYEKISGIYKLGPEPLNKNFNFQVFQEIYKTRKGAVKKNLLDQTKIAGIGNIYADEACFYTGIKPDRGIETLTESQLQELHKNIIKALNLGIRNRGTSIATYADAYGKSGKNQEGLFAYGRGGKPCLKCKTTMVKTRVASRGTVYCPSCQA